MAEPIFEKLASSEGFRALFEAARHREIPKNRVVIKDGETPDHLYLLLSGLACVRNPGSDGNELLLAYFHAGDFFGEMGLFPNVQARSATVRAASACSVLEIPYREFIRLSGAYPELWLELAGQLAERLRSTNRRLAEMPALQAADRVWQVIQEMARHLRATAVGGKVIQITRKDLGKLAGCSREVAGLVLAAYARSGRIRLRGRAIIVPDLASV